MNIFNDKINVVLKLFNKKLSFFCSLLFFVLFSFTQPVFAQAVPAQAVPAQAVPAQAVPAQAGSTIPAVTPESLKTPTLAQQNLALQSANSPLPASDLSLVSSASLPPSTTPSQLPPLPITNLPLPKVTSREAQNRYFDITMANKLGVTPAEIKELRREINLRAKAVSDLPMKAPRPVSGSITVSLSPGSTPPIIRPFYGEISSFVVVDKMGNPWPVENFRIGNSTLFDVNRLDGPDGSSFTIDAKTFYGYSNLVLKLNGIPTPVVINLVAGQAVQDARTEVRVDGLSPTAPPVIGDNLPPGTSSELLPVLDGIPPSNSKSLEVIGDPNARAWLTINNNIILRTKYKIVSPASKSFISSSDGTNVYILSQTPQVLGMMNGQFVNMEIKGF